MPPVWLINGQHFHYYCMRVTSSYYTDGMSQSLFYLIELYIVLYRQHVTHQTFIKAHKMHKVWVFTNTCWHYFYITSFQHEGCSEGTTSHLTMYISHISAQQPIIHACRIFAFPFILWEVGGGLLHCSCPCCRPWSNPSRYYLCTAFESCMLMLSVLNHHYNLHIL